MNSTDIPIRNSYVDLQVQDQPTNQSAEMATNNANSILMENSTNKEKSKTHAVGIDSVLPVPHGPHINCLGTGIINPKKEINTK